MCACRVWWLWYDGEAAVGLGKGHCAKDAQLDGLHGREEILSVCTYGSTARKLLLSLTGCPSRTPCRLRSSGLRC